MATTLTIKQRAELEERYRVMIDKGMTVREIAAELRVTTQAVRKFLSVRGWHTQSSK